MSRTGWFLYLGGVALWAVSCGVVTHAYDIDGAWPYSLFGGIAYGFFLMWLAKRYFPLVRMTDTSDTGCKHAEATKKTLKGGAGPDEAAVELDCPSCGAYGWTYCDGSTTWRKPLKPSRGQAYR